MYVSKQANEMLAFSVSLPITNMFPHQARGSCMHRYVARTMHEREQIISNALKRQNYTKYCQPMLP